MNEESRVYLADMDAVLLLVEVVLLLGPAAEDAKVLINFRYLSCVWYKNTFFVSFELE